MKRPAFQFYPADWRKDAALQSCDVAARGMWLEMMCVMHECVPYGHLTVNGGAMSDAQAARLCGVELREYRRLLAELDRAGVPGRTAEGVIYSRRMVRDEEVRNKRANGGHAGGVFGHLGAEHGSKGGRSHKETGDKKPPLEPPPSSSSSSSMDTSVGVPTSEAGGEKPPPVPAERWPGNLRPETWAAWKAHLSQRGKPMSTPQERAQLAKLGSYPDAELAVRSDLERGRVSLTPPGGYSGDQDRPRHGEKRGAAASAIFGASDHERRHETDITAAVERIA